MPTDAQAWMMIVLLVYGSGYTVPSPSPPSWPVLDSLWRECWIDGADDLTWLGRDALARYLLRAWRP